MSQSTGGTGLLHQGAEPGINKKIFIGGTGRSGTTILSRFLGSHKEIYNLPVESRFIIDKGGMIDLFYSLTRNYSIDQSRVALREFTDLMKKKMVDPFDTPYLGFDFYQLFGREFYYKTLDSFIGKIVCGSFVGTDFHALYDRSSVSVFLRNKLGKEYRLYRRIRRKIFGFPFDIPVREWPREEMFICRYFVDENELLSLMGSFINDLFMYNAKVTNKKHWCEDTPANIQHIPVLHRLFDEVYFIHIVRNPIGVAFSMKNMVWAPNEYESIVKFVSNTYEKLIQAEEFAITNGIKLKRIKLEDLAADHQRQRKELMEFLNLDDEFIDPPVIESNKVNYFEEEISEKDKEFLRKRLQKYIDCYDYWHNS